MRFKIGLALCCLLTVSAGWLVWQQRDWLGEQALRRLMAQSLFANPAVSGLSLTMDHAALAHLQFELETGKGLLAAELSEANLNYDWQTLQPDTGFIEKAKLTFHYRADSDTDTTPAEDSAAALRLPLRSLSIKQLDLTVIAPWGESRFIGQAEFNTAEQQTVQVLLNDSEYALSIGQDFGAGMLSLQLRKADGSAIAAGNYGRNPPDNSPLIGLQANVELLRGWLTQCAWLPNQIRQPLAALIWPALDKIQAQLHLHGNSPEDHKRFKGYLQLTEHNDYLAGAELELAADELAVDAHLALSAAQARRLAAPWLPTATSAWQVNAGEIMGAVRMHWQAGKPMTHAVFLKGYDLGLAIGSTHISKGFVQLDAAESTLPTYIVSLTVPSWQLNENTEFRDIQLNAAYQNGRLAIDQASLPMFGGKLQLEPAELELTGGPIRLILVVNNVDLQQLLQAMNYPNLSGTGMLNGKLPLSVESDTVELKDGTLTGIVPGVLRYTGPGDDGNLAFSALRNLQYHALQAGVDYRPDGSYSLGLRLEGKNPSVLSGHPLAFNLKLHGQLPELLQKGVLAGDFERPILEQVKNAKP
ncbi:YdbH domain-containing protein [Methylomonas sp. HYX-M1]|uniref:intermembrane phospholipid transport protein YdbH family protein n=1 Tax=Methylomonas sp. HYX-M1 TaxID=3139307 RepID=UPI00345BAF4C